MRRDAAPPHTPPRACISHHLQGQRKVAQERRDARAACTVTQFKESRSIRAAPRLEARTRPEIEAPSRRRKGAPGRSSLVRGSGDCERGERPLCLAKARRQAGNMPALVVSRAASLGIRPTRHSINRYPQDYSRRAGLILIGVLRGVYTDVRARAPSR